MRSCRFYEACRANMHRYNGSWTRDVQNVIFAILLCGWLGGLTKDGKPAESGRLLTIEEVGEILQGMLHIVFLCQAHG